MIEPKTKIEASMGRNWKFDNEIGWKNKGYRFIMGKGIYENQGTLSVA